MVNCPRCDNPVEADLQPPTDGDLVCQGGPAPCGWAWEREA